MEGARPSFGDAGGAKMSVETVSAVSAVAVGVIEQSVIVPLADVASGLVRIVESAWAYVQRA